MPSAYRLHKYQLAGLDDRERGFSRPVELESDGESYRAVLRYEDLVLATEAHQTQDEALQNLIRMLQDRGYRQLKSQQSFRNGVYLGSQELWIEYPDRPSVAGGWVARIAAWFRWHASRTER